MSEFSALVSVIEVLLRSRLKGRPACVLIGRALATELVAKLATLTLRALLSALCVMWWTVVRLAGPP